jgi:hypothetical protein
MSIIDDVLGAACLLCGCTLMEVLPSGDECRKARKCLKCGATFVVWQFGEDDESKQD